MLILKESGINELNKMNNLLKQVIKNRKLKRNSDNANSDNEQNIFSSFLL